MDDATPDPRQEDTEPAAPPGDDALCPTTPMGSSRKSTERPHRETPFRSGDSELRQVGPYRILEKVGEGGMGTVYVAEQREPVRRKVALKVIKLGMDTKEVLARFEVEHHALTLMNHPSIARVLDAGATPEGRPYFVMEYVPGVPVSEYCDRETLSTRERLELFIPICAAVQHAHQKGIIHRDLKPSNVLVTLQDGKPAPKIIDFGVAKATAHRLTEQTLHTELGQIIGTPEYMSPEQAEVTGMDIDTRSDVYSLGVILYELLVGALPFDARTLRSRGYAEVQRIIREVDPPKPSTRLSSMAAGTEVAAQQRKSDARSLSRRLRGDLDWITMKALEKNRTRRYESASELAADITRHLSHEPVMAGPPGMTYRLGKFVRKNRMLVSASVVVLIALLIGFATTWLQYQRAETERAESVRQRDRADRKAEEADRERTRALDAEAEAEERYQEIVRLSDIQRLADAQTLAEGLWPALPAGVAGMEAWLDGKARPLVENLPKHRATLEELRKHALPPTAEEIRADRASHPRVPALRAAQDQLTYLEALLVTLDTGVVSGEASPDWDILPEALHALSDHAWWLIEPERTTFGRESEGLAIARRVSELAGGNDPAHLDTLAWALHARGLDKDAVQAATRALEHAPEDEKDEYQLNLEELRAAVATRGTPAWKEETQARITSLQASVKALESEVNERLTWRFADEESQWQHGLLAELVAGLELFVSEDSAVGLVSGMRGRLEWARTIEDRSVSGPDAAVAWRRASDEIASLEAYGGLVLKPQPGLLPLRRDPKSGFWEFWHLQSGSRPEPNPDPDAPSSWHITGETGLILVLIPGGTVTLGAQSDSPGEPLHDPRAEKGEGPPYSVTLAPFLISKYEMTEGQWARACRFFQQPQAAAPEVEEGDPWAHPLRNRTWDDLQLMLDRLDLLLPTECQWEYATRARSETPWFTGREAASLQGAANVSDRYLASIMGLPDGSYVNEIDDGFQHSAPVGTFRPNRFGLHDVHGNVAEWCRDEYGRLRATRKPGDGERIHATSWWRVIRGGSFRSVEPSTRSSARRAGKPHLPVSDTGVRPAFLIR